MGDGSVGDVDCGSSNCSSQREVNMVGLCQHGRCDGGGGGEDCGNGGSGGDGSSDGCSAGGSIVVVEG